jgi:branched-chain amino acid transport system ATP-binding protein
MIAPALIGHAVAASLTIERLNMQFGGLTALNQVSFTAQPREITAIIGPNGAGKTTLFNCLTGFYRPTQGRMILNHADGRCFHLEQLRDFQVAAQAGVARTFQNIRLFPNMTVAENLLVAQHNRLMRASGYSIFALLALPGYGHAERAAIDLARYWLDQVGLLDRADDPAGSLSYGQQRRIEIARAMCTQPVLLCLDEPAAGLNARESAELNQLLLTVRDRSQIAILLIEHDMSVVMEISDHVVVLDHGEVIATGTPAEIRSNPAVIRAYLGAEDDAELPLEIGASPPRVQ